ncbi:MAG: molecular chaperone TorD family protein [Gemmatimonadota bacterium]|nr:MAG: molecular chaperone TorD family protein [Gemmatimonadota bacterium]
MESKEFLSREEHRRDTYKLLSECYYSPDEGLLNTLRESDTSRGSLYSEISKNSPTTNNVESLKIDYAKLFLGPYKLLAPPYGSVYLENARRVMGDSTMDIWYTYAEEGLRVDLKEAPDHIAIELEFMCFLISKEIEAALNSDSINTTRYLRKQKDFLENHLAIWVLEFTDTVEANAETEFYKHLARLTRSFIKKDLKRLSES